MQLPHLMRHGVTPRHCLGAPAAACYPLSTCHEHTVTCLKHISHAGQALGVLHGTVACFVARKLPSACAQAWSGPHQACFADEQQRWQPQHTC